jgi:hypothetical protein
MPMKQLSRTSSCSPPCAYSTQTLLLSRFATRDASSNERHADWNAGVHAFVAGWHDHPVDGAAWAGHAEESRSRRRPEASKRLGAVTRRACVPAAQPGVCAGVPR